MTSKEQYVKALQLLESPATYPGLALRPRARTLFRIWRYPSFQPYSSWALIEAATQFYLRRVTWDQSQQVTITPVTYGSEVPIESPAYEGLLLRLRDIQLSPFIAVSTLGLDGISYGVEIESFGISARLSWWNTPPSEWTTLASWHAEAIEKFDELLPASTPDFDRD